MKTCKNCDELNVDQAKYCKTCGLPLASKPAAFRNIWLMAAGIAGIGLLTLVLVVWGNHRQEQRREAERQAEASRKLQEQAKQIEEAKQNQQEQAKQIEELRHQLESTHKALPSPPPQPTRLNPKREAASGFKNESSVMSLAGTTWRGSNAELYGRNPVLFHFKVGGELIYEVPAGDLRGVGKNANTKFWWAFEKSTWVQTGDSVYYEFAGCTKHKGIIIGDRMEVESEAMEGRCTELGLEKRQYILFKEAKRTKPSSKSR